MSFNENHSPIIKEKDINIFKVRFMNFAQSKCPEFVIDERNKEIVNELFIYFMRLPGGAYDLDKGIWFAGPVGTGKTTLLNVFALFLREVFIKGFKVFLAPMIAREYSEGTDLFNTKNLGENVDVVDVLDKYTNNKYGIDRYVPIELGIDELGKEVIPSYRYKQPLNVLEFILFTRYSLWQIHKMRTHITTNLSAKQVAEMYGIHIADRIREMFNVVTLDGPSRRK